MSTSLDVQSVLDAEEARCRAVNERDWDSLSGLYGDEFMHHHQNGRIDDLDGELTTLKARARTMSRSDLEATVYGDVAVMTGYFTSVFDDGSAGLPGLHFMQVWVKRDGAWRLVKTHSAKHPVD